MAASQVLINANPKSERLQRDVDQNWLKALSLSLSVCVCVCALSCIFFPLVYSNKDLDLLSAQEQLLKKRKMVRKNLAKQPNVLQFYRELPRNIANNNNNS